VAFVACDTPDNDGANAGSDNSAQQEENKDTKCIVNGVEYEAMIAHASSSVVDGYKVEYNMEIRVLIINHNDVDFHASKDIFKLTASNEKALSGGIDYGYFGEITVWSYDSIEDFVVPAKSAVAIDLSFNSGVISSSDYVKVSYNDEDGSIEEYSLSNNIYDEFIADCNDYMHATEFKIYVGNTVISEINFTID
jgi:hypothetical protein